MAIKIQTASSRGSCSFVSGFGACLVLMALFNLQSSSMRITFDYYNSMYTEPSEFVRTSNTVQSRKLVDIVTDDLDLECPGSLVPVHDSNRHLLDKSDGTTLRQIPKIVHITAPSRCLPQVFKDNIDRWRFPDHTVLIHDDAAVQRLLDLHFPEFPEIPKLVHCLLSGAGKADLWRAVVLWEYGGIYTDFDTGPNGSFRKGAAIENNDESFFVVEREGWLSQYFMAAMPRHPLLYLLIHKITQRLYSLNEVDGQYVPRSTGPGALKYAFIAFMGDSGPNIYEGFGNCNARRPYEYGKVVAGKYSGWDNRTVTVRGNQTRPDAIIQRNRISNKEKIYKKEMNMTHFIELQKQVQGINKDSCFRRIYERQQLAEKGLELESTSSDR